MASRSSSTPLLRALRAPSSAQAVGSTGMPSLSSRSLSSTAPDSRRAIILPPVPQKPVEWSGQPSENVDPFLPPRKGAVAGAHSSPRNVSPLFPLAVMPRGSTQGTKINARTEQAYLNSAPPTPQALSAIARRLHLEDTDETAALLVKAITHNSFVPAAYEGSLGRTSGKPIDPLKSNEHLAEVGRSILGFVLSEYYGKKFPNLPTKALKLLMTAVTNTDAMESVGSEIGLGKHGVPIRYKRSVETVTVPVTAQARRHKMTTTELHQRGRKGGPVYEMEQRVVQSNYHAVGITSAIRAIIGLIYQEKGFDAAAAFINGHFISRQVDVPSLLRFEQPYRILESTVVRYGLAHPVGRLLKESGRLSSSPYYVVGYFSDDIKLGEGFGSSMVMASHRAATNALQTLYLATPSSLVPILSIPTLPTHPLDNNSTPLFDIDAEYRALAPAIGESEAVFASSDRAGSHGFVPPTDDSGIQGFAGVQPSGVDREPHFRGVGAERVGSSLVGRGVIGSGMGGDWRDVKLTRKDRRTKKEKMEDGKRKGEEMKREREGKGGEVRKVTELWREGA